MSLRGRYAIDRIKRAVSRYLSMPVPPYQEASYWEGVYKSLGPDDVFEWGDLSCQDFSRYTYRMHEWTSPQSPRFHNNADQESPLIETTLGETLGVYPHAAYDEPIMMLGCGNSKFGEDMLQEGFRGPLMQVDISSRVIESMSHRCAALQRSGDMQFVQDDATVLSAFNDNKVAAVFDKGLVDALFCANAYDQCWDVMRAVHRVLQPGGHFCVISFSRPEFLWDKLMVPPNGVVASRAMRNMWGSIQIRELDRVLLYRFQKQTKDKVDAKNTRKKGKR